MKKFEIVGDGFVIDQEEQRDLIHGRGPIRRFLEWFGNLSDMGQFLFWTALLLPPTVLGVMLYAMKTLEQSVPWFSLMVP